AEPRGARQGSRRVLVRDGAASMGPRGHWGTRQRIPTPLRSRLTPPRRPWWERFLAAAENALRSRPKDEEALKDEQIQRARLEGLTCTSAPADAAAERAGVPEPGNAEQQKPPMREGGTDVRRTRTRPSRPHGLRGAILLLGLGVGARGADDAGVPDEEAGRSGGVAKLPGQGEREGTAREGGGP